MTFLFEPGTWLGEGKISFSITTEELRFFTRWTVSETEEEGTYLWTQRVEMAQDGEKIENHFAFTPLKEGIFSVKLENEFIGKAIGKGVFDENKVAWEVTSPESFQGFESYIKKEAGRFAFHAEYIAPDNFRTIINGEIWKKSQ
jgi:hypothetical protein